MAYELIPVIDELKVCYIAGEEFLAELRSVESSISISDVTFYRTESHHFRYAYNICIGDVEHRQQVATARFGRYGDEGDNGYFFYRLENHVLYDCALMDYAMSLPEQFGLVFHNFTSLDIAIDTKTDVAHLMKRMWMRKDITTIVNGKAVKDRKAIVNNVSLVYSTTLDRLKGLTVYVKQKKALHDKTKGVTVQAYNKLAEIDEASHKEYIREYYGNPKKLYRLEVHLNNAEISDYCKSRQMYQNEDLIYDQGLLTDMFFYHLGAVIRFTKGRTKLSWEDIIRSNGRL